MDKFINYYKEHLQPKVREALKLAACAFFTTLWDFLKEDIILSARKSLKLIEEIVHSPKGREKKAQIVELIMLKIKLPLIAKPFKGVIKKMVSNKIDEIVETLLGKGFEVLG